jgi:nucleotide-binding universal stress UspA family protein
MIKRILVALDGSASAQAALAEAMVWAPRADAPCPVLMMA